MNRDLMLICDSGSTKTHWQLLYHKKVIASYQTIGLNPYFTTHETLTTEIEKTFESSLKQKVKQIHFYGAGCNAEEKTNLIKQGLTSSFSKANIHVNSDLLGAARALFKNKPGLAVILGTGSSMAWYDGNSLKKNAPSLGFILGDEGSGANLGKKLISTYLNNDLSQSLHKAFEDFTPLRKPEILDSVYRQPIPNRFLASFVEFLVLNQEHPDIATLLYQSFGETINKINRYFTEEEKNNIGFAGSVAYQFRKQLKKVAEEKGIQIHTIIKSPILELTLYHQSENCL